MSDKVKDGLLNGIIILFVFAMGCLVNETVRTPNQTLKKYGDSSTHFLFIRGNRWTLEVTEQSPFDIFSNAYGFTDCKARKITLKSNLDYTTQRDAIIHEVFHAGTCDTNGKAHNLYWNSSTEISHEGIYRISDYLTQILHDNPEFTNYLAGQ